MMLMLEATQSAGRGGILEELQRPLFNKCEILASHAVMVPDKANSFMVVTYTKLGEP